MSTLGQPASVQAPLTWIENSASALVHNVQQVRTVLGPSVEIAACVKGNAYGHGIASVGPALERAGVDRMAIFSVEEARLLREVGVTVPLLQMGYTPASQLSELFEHGTESFVFDLSQAREISQVAASLSRVHQVHVKVDTGMTRLGVRLDELKDFLSEVTALPGVKVAGFATHFASSDEEGERTFVHEQLENFACALEMASDFNLGSMLRQAANSAAILQFPQTHFDLVRPGRMLYGYAPDEAFLVRHAPNLEPLRQVISVKTRVIQLKRVPSGTSISYNQTYVTDKDTTIAVLPTGYADGISRFLGNKADVLIAGRRCPIRGKICMNAMMVDVSGVPGAQVGQEVVLIGTQGEQTISTYEHARLCNTLPYNVLTAFQAYVPRQLVN